MNRLKNEKLPEFFRPLLWSYDFSKIDPDRDKKLIVVNAVNYGDLIHWRWLINFYGKENVKKILSEIPVTELRPQVRSLISLMFGVEKFSYAPRGVK